MKQSRLWMTFPFGGFLQFDGHVRERFGDRALLGQLDSAESARKYDSTIGSQVFETAIRTTRSVTVHFIQAQKGRL